MMLEELVGANGRTPRKPTYTVFVHHRQNPHGTRVPASNRETQHKR